MAARRKLAWMSGTPTIAVPAVESVAWETQLGQHLRRRALPFRDEPVAHVPQVLDAHLARPEPGCREVAEGIEERRAVLDHHAEVAWLAHLRLVLLLVLAVGDLVEDRGTLRLRGLGEPMPEPLLG